MKKWMLLLALPLSLALITGGCSSTPAVSTIPDGSPSVSNGQRIFLHADSNSGQEISYTEGPSMMMQNPLNCAYCHGENGHGGTVTFMMNSYDVPDISWPAITTQGMGHEPYTEVTLKQAITQGLDPGGTALEYPMPRWKMSTADLNDLAAFIMALK